MSEQLNKVPPSGIDMQAAMRTAQSLLANAQKPDMRVLAINKEIDMLDRELTRCHESYNVAVANRESDFVFKEQIKDLNLRLDLAITRYHELAHRSGEYGEQVKSPPEKSPVHAVDEQK